MSAPKTPEEWKKRVENALRVYERRTRLNPHARRKAMMTSEDFAQRYMAEEIRKAKKESA